MHTMHTFQLATLSAHPPPLPTLCLCPAGVVKMRRGAVAKVMYRLDDFADVCAAFLNYAEDLKAKVDQVRRACSEVADLCYWLP